MMKKVVNGLTKFEADKFKEVSIRKGLRTPWASNENRGRVTPGLSVPGFDSHKKVWDSCLHIYVA